MPNKLLKKVMGDLSSLPEPELRKLVQDQMDEADLVATPFEMTTEDGRVITGNTYAVQSVDGQTGEIYACKVKPILDSDKTKLEMLLR